MLSTPPMRRRQKLIEDLASRIQTTHTPAQRAGCPRDLADDFISLHATDPQFLPEADLNFPLMTMLLGSMYLGDQLGFAVYHMVANPDLQDRVGAEADALFANGDPGEIDLTSANIDVARRLVMETLRVTPIAAMSLRHVMNTCDVNGYQLALGSRAYIAHTACHYMEEMFPDPFKFDIDRYLPPRNEHLSPGYAPFGLGTHSCLGRRWGELHLALNLLLLAHYFRLELPSPDYKLRINSFPSMSPSKKLNFVIAEQRHAIAG
jgi:cytochrome P450